MEFIFFGERFSSAQTDGNFGTFTCLTSELGVEWDAIQSALDRGQVVIVRQPTATELQCMDELLTFYRSHGMPAYSLDCMRVYH